MEGVRLSVSDHKQREKEGDRGRNESVWKGEKTQWGKAAAEGKEDESEEQEEKEESPVSFICQERWRRKVEEKCNRQTYDSESDPHGGEGIHPLTAASRPDEVWPSGGRTGPEDFPLLQNTSCLLFSCNVTARSLLPCHTLTCTVCDFCVTLCAHRLRSWLSGPFQPWTNST